MATYQDFKDLTANLGLEDDCPICGYSWPGCQGMCIAHESMNGHPGPYHYDYNDDCEKCPRCRRCGKVLDFDPSDVLFALCWRCAATEDAMAYTLGS